MSPSRVCIFGAPTLLGGRNYMMHPLRIFHFNSVSFISVCLDMATTYQVCYGVDCHPGGAGRWLMHFGLTCSSTWQGGGDTGGSGFLYDFAIILLLATFICFHVTIFHCLSSSYSPMKIKYFSGVPVFSSYILLDLTFSIFCQTSSALC